MSSPSGPGAPASPTSGSSFEGIGLGLPGYTILGAPPDPNGAVSSQFYVEVVNTDIAIFNRSGALLSGPSNINTLWKGFGGGCEVDNDGDPTVIYDRLADRWLVSQFAVTTTKYLNCVAVSTTNDPRGAYARYSYFYANFPDYPKFGMWPDAYYVSFNMFRGGSTFSGPTACAYDRSRMLTGASASMQCTSLGTAYSSLLPSTLDGPTPPPAGSPDYFVALGTSSSLLSWKFHVDWATPSNSTFVGPTSITVPSYGQACGGATCIPQLGTSQQLDSLGDRAMYRFAYRNFGDHEALVVNHSVTAGSSVGVRWYELRLSSGSLGLFQSGTHAPDANYRWMGSVALDKAGDIGLGYSTSGVGMKPAIRFTGRLATDPLGTMETEGTIIQGAGAQNGNLARWGDYTSLAVDPVDDCTFWYTNEYLASDGSFNWHTRVGTFQFGSCVTPPAPGYSLSASPSSQSVVQGSGTSYSVTVTPVAGYAGTVSFSVSGLPSGASASFNPGSVNTSGTSTMSVGTNASTPVGSYPLTISGTDGTTTHTTSVTLVVTAPPSPDFSLSASPASQTVARGASTTYTATVTASNGFNGNVAFSVRGLPGGASAKFNPTSVTGSGSSSMTVSTSSSTPKGTYQLTISATSSTGVIHTTTVTIVVKR